jgi:hypothetical protein
MSRGAPVIACILPEGRGVSPAQCASTYGRCASAADGKSSDPATGRGRHNFALALAHARPRSGQRTGWAREGIKLALHWRCSKDLEKRPSRIKPAASTLFVMNWRPNTVPLPRAAAFRGPLSAHKASSFAFGLLQRMLEHCP